MLQCRNALKHLGNGTSRGMPRDTLTGSRIRERRSMVGLRQADLAREVGISASYLNLIEHNRRRIGGKLLVDIAGVLGVEPSLLTEGAEAALIATLREAAADAGAATSDTDRADEFEVYCNFVIHRHRRQDERSVHVGGREDVLRSTASGYQLVRRKINLDARVVQDKNLYFFA